MAAKPSDRPDVQIFDEIGQIDYLTRAVITRHLPVGLTYPQYEVLNLLSRSGDRQTPAQIATALMMTKGAITNTLQRLEARRLITVEADAVDKRKKRVSMTPAGVAACAQTLNAMRPKIERLRGGFTEREFRDALPFLRALRAWMEEHR